MYHTTAQRKIKKIIGPGRVTAKKMRATLGRRDTTVKLPGVK